MQKEFLVLWDSAAKKGAEITVTVDGEDEEIAAAELETFLKENL